MFTKNSSPTSSTIELDAKLAQEIYTAIKKYGSWDAAFTAEDTNFDYTNCIAVSEEIQRVEAIVLQKMVEKAPATQAELEESLDTLLDKKMFVSDMVIYYPTYLLTRTFKDWVKVFDTKVF